MNNAVSFNCASKIEGIYALSRPAPAMCFAARSAPEWLVGRRSILRPVDAPSRSVHAALRFAQSPYATLSWVAQGTLGQDGCGPGAQEIDDISRGHGKKEADEDDGAPEFAKMIGSDGQGGKARRSGREESRQARGDVARGKARVRCGRLNPCGVVSIWAGMPDGAGACGAWLPIPGAGPTRRQNFAGRCPDGAGGPGPTQVRDMPRRNDKGPTWKVSLLSSR